MNIDFYVNIDTQIKPYCQSAINEYTKRLSAYCKTSITYTNHHKQMNVTTVDSKKTKIIKMIAGEISGNHFYMNMEYGNSKKISDVSHHTSENLACTFQKWMNEGCSNILIVIDKMEDTYNELVIVSRFDISIDILTIIAYEQVYRAWKIIRGEPYHK